MRAPIYPPSAEQRHGALFAFSAFMFRMGLALITFEQIRPLFGIQLSDYCFFVSLLLLVSRPKSLVTHSKGSGVLLAGALILAGGMLSLRNASSLGDAFDALARLLILFGMFAPLAVVHSKEIRKNMLYLVAGISANCGVTLVQAWIFPGIVKTLSINPGAPDLSDIGRWQGLTSHPNTLGLAAALAVLIAVGLLSYGGRQRMRVRLVMVISICSIGAVLSGSRTVLVALIPALLVFAVLERWHRRAIIWALVAPLILWGPLSYLAPQALSQFSERLESSGANYSSDSTRVITGAMTLVEISQKPILGWGVDYFGDAAKLLTVENGDMLGTENTFLRYWYAAGLLGAIGFVVLFVVPTRITLQISRISSSSAGSKNALHLALACYMLLFIASNLHPFLYNRYLYVPMFVFAGFAACLRRPVGGSALAAVAAA